MKAMNSIGGELVVKFRDIGNVTDALFRLQRVLLNIVTADFRRTGTRCDESREQLDGRCFPRRVRPEESKKLTALYRELETVEGEEFAVAHGKVGYFNHSILGGTSRR